jgi:hypothetical protein
MQKRIEEKMDDSKVMTEKSFSTTLLDKWRHLGAK